MLYCREFGAIIIPMTRLAPWPTFLQAAYLGSENTREKRDTNTEIQNTRRNEQLVKGEFGLPDCVRSETRHSNS